MRSTPSLLGIDGLSSSAPAQLLSRARQLRAQDAPREQRAAFAAFLTDRESVRTRLSVHRAAFMLGIDAVDLDFRNSFYADPARRGDHAGFVKAELASIRHLGCDALIVRAHDHRLLQLWNDLEVIPMINGCSDKEHPLQALSDALVLTDRFPQPEDLTVTLVGNGASPVFISLLLLLTRMHINVVLVCPEGFGFPAEVVASSHLEREPVETRELEAALSATDVIYSDSVVYRGLTDAENEAFRAYRLTSELVSRCAPSAYIMHCLPHAEEIDSALLFGERALAMQQVAARVPVTAAAIEFVSDWHD